ncbi:MAG TPA: hypothetical protein VL527_14310, partial [Dongiaceae bacterium]|nr:hypothetical protein [Dongiaceae bacterium]
MPSPYPIRPAMMRLLQAELRPEEQLQWSQQPRPLALAGKKWPLCLAGLFFFGVPAFTMWILAFSPAKQIPLSLLGVILSFLGLFAGCGAGMLLAPLWAGWKATRTVYAITDQRCLAITAAWRRRIQYWHVGRGAAELIDLHRTEDHQGRGDLFFHRQIVPVRHGYRYVDAGFAGIR